MTRKLSFHFLSVAANAPLLRYVGKRSGSARIRPHLTLVASLFAARAAPSRSDGQILVDARLFCRKRGIDRTTDTSPRNRDLLRRLADDFGFNLCILSGRDSPRVWINCHSSRRPLKTLFCAKGRSYALVVGLFGQGEERRKRLCKLCACFVATSKSARDRHKIMCNLKNFNGRPSRSNERKETVQIFNPRPVKRCVSAPLVFFSSSIPQFVSN